MGRLNFVPGVFSLSLLALLATPGFAQFSAKAISSSLSGTVFSAGSDRRIANATVTLYDDQGARLQEILSGVSGEFSFDALRGGRYVLRVRAEGFAPSEMPVDLTMNSQHGVFVSLKEQVPASSAVSQRPTISAHELAMPEKARDLMNSGIHKLYKEKNPQGALSDFQSAAAKAPAFYEAYYQAGMAYLTLQNEAEAEKQFRTSVDVSKNMYGDADIALATLLLRRQPEDEGEALLRQGLALNPQSWPGQVELGKLELSRGHMETALGAAKKAESLAPQQPIVYRLLSVIHLKQKDYSALMTDLDTYIRLDSDSPAGLRAKEMRAQLARQLTQSQTAAASATVK